MCFYSVPFRTYSVAKASAQRKCEEHNKWNFILQGSLSEKMLYQVISVRLSFSSIIIFFSLKVNVAKKDNISVHLVYMKSG